MAFGDTIRQGAASLDPDDPKRVLVTGNLLTINAAPGDSFELGGLDVTIASLLGDDGLMLAYPWPGSSFTDDETFLIHQTAFSRWSPLSVASNISDIATRLRLYNRILATFSIKAFGVNVEPDDYVVGDRLVVGSAGQGAFAGHEGQIAERQQAGWLFISPEHGIATVDEVNHVYRMWTGVAWSSAVGLRASAGIGFIFSTSTEDADPGAGALRLDAADPAEASHAYISTQEIAGVNIGAWLDTFDDGGAAAMRGMLKLESSIDPAVFRVYSVVGSVSAEATYRKLSLEHIAGNGVLAAGVEVRTSFYPAGATFHVDETGPLAARSEYDDRAAGFVFLATDAGDIYVKLSDAATDWSDPIHIVGPQGEPAKIVTTSATNVTMATGTIGFVVADADFQTALGLRLRAASNDGSKVLEGSVIALALPTVSIAVDYVEGSGSHAAWHIGPAGARGRASVTTVAGVTTLAPGSPATVANTGTASDPALSFGIPAGEPGESFTPDHFVDDLAGRAAYDDAAEGVSVIVHADSGHDGKPWLYAKASAASADWTAGHEWTLEGVVAADVSYDPSDSGLTATDAQAALDEIKAAVDALPDAIQYAIALGS